MCANLVENAMTFCPAGTTVSPGLPRSHPGISLTVADNGPGIPEGERTTGLRRLYRLENSRTTPGSGLGQSMVKAIAALHGAAVALADDLPGRRVTMLVPDAVRGA